jgi:hypothetical protein
VARRGGGEPQRRGLPRDHQRPFRSPPCWRTTCSSTTTTSSLSSLPSSACTRRPPRAPCPRREALAADYLAQLHERFAAYEVFAALPDAPRVLAEVTQRVEAYAADAYALRCAPLAQGHCLFSNSLTARVEQRAAPALGLRLAGWRCQRQRGGGALARRRYGCTCFVCTYRAISRHRSP